mgnify:CR=1 FL=1
MEVEFSARGRRANLWLSRPACRNALSKLALRELIRACDALQLRHDTTIVVLAGRGKSFCAGADLNDAPGVVDTEMQSEIRAASPGAFPELQKFVDYKAEGKLLDPEFVASFLVGAIHKEDFGEVIDVDIRDHIG